MDRYVIKGGYPLRGSLTVQGAKNSILPILAAVVLNGSKEPIRLKEVPDIVDVRGMLAILNHLGAESEWEGKELIINTYPAEGFHVPEELMKEMRSSIVMLGPLLGRFGKAKMYYPGGCAIGERPIDLHINGLQQMGAVIEESNGHIIAAGRLKGGEIHLKNPSVGATENLMMSAVLARGETVIHNAAREPEIVDLQNFLNTLGAQISGAGSNTVMITGVPSLTGGEYRAYPDRIAAGTYIIAAIATGGEITVKDIYPDHLEPLLQVLQQAGANIQTGRDWITVKGGCLESVPNVDIIPHPGFPTDLQPQLLALMAMLPGKSTLIEHVFPKRFHHVAELNRMGALICQKNNKVEIRGVRQLKGAVVNASDLRAGAALVIAGLAARGKTIVTGVNHIVRGYEELHTVFKNLGGKIELAG